MQKAFLGGMICATEMRRKCGRICGYGDKIRRGYGDGKKILFKSKHKTFLSFYILNYIVTPGKYENI